MKMKKSLNSLKLGDNILLNENLTRSVSTGSGECIIKIKFSDPTKNSTYFTLLVKGDVFTVKKINEKSIRLETTRQMKVEKHVIGKGYTSKLKNISIRLPFNKNENILVETVN
jgi:hypothetical protein